MSLDPHNGSIIEVFTDNSLLFSLILVPLAEDLLVISLILGLFRRVFHHRTQPANI